MLKRIESLLYKRNIAGKSIQTRITMLAWFLIVFAAAIFVVANFYAQKAMIIDRMRNEAINVAASIEQLTASSVYNEDYTTVVEYCLPLVQKGRSISYINIVKYDGLSLLFTEKNWVLDNTNEQRFIKPELSKNYEFYFEPKVDAEVFHYVYKFNYSGLNWGWIHVGLSLEKYNADIASTLWNALYISLIALLIGFVVSAWFARRLIKPIQLLDRVAQQISAGDWGQQAQISTGDELERLAHSFNEMTDQLRKGRDELEERVRERTLELANTNKKLIAEIQARKKSEAAIADSLAEKEVLLKEIHHRVKNNLQIVSSLLYLQSRNIEDEKTIMMFTDSRNRILSMALIHENLYRSNDLAFIDIEEYIRNLTRELSSSFGREDRRVQLEMSIADIPMGIDKAIPVGLIVNELISNAYKYAFTGRENEDDNIIQIELKKASKGQVILVVADNGPGLPENVDFRQSPSLGLQLVNSLVSQLDGQVSYQNSGGSRFEIDFSID